MESVLQQLEAHVASGNVEAGLELLQQIKLARITTASGGGSGVSDVQYAAALECGVFLSVVAQDLDLFARHMQQLQPLYATIQYQHDNSTQTDANNANTVLFPRQNHILGLHLMALLVTASSSEFHSELELLHHNKSTHPNTANPESDPFLQFPIAVERKLMVGIYDEILSLPVPHASYQFFMDELSRTVLEAIADCLEVSYASLTLAQAAGILKLKTVSELKEYIATAREDWIVEKDTIVFAPAAVGSGDLVTTMTTMLSAQDIPSEQWIQQSLTYASEMERIV